MSSKHHGRYLGVSHLASTLCRRTGCWARKSQQRKDVSGTWEVEERRVKQLGSEEMLNIPKGEGLTERGDGAKAQEAPHHYWKFFRPKPGWCGEQGARRVWKWQEIEVLNGPSVNWTKWLKSVQKVCICSDVMKGWKNKIWQGLVEESNRRKQNCYLSYLCLMEHRPFNKLDVKATNIIQLDHYIKLLTSLPASTLVSIKCDLAKK